MIEQEANTFAAALLMPAEMIERYYRSTGRDFSKLCDVFESSRRGDGPPAARGDLSFRARLPRHSARPWYECSYHTQHGAAHDHPPG